MNQFTVPAGFAILLSACTIPGPSGHGSIPGPAKSVTRAEAVAIARAYVDTAWLGQDHHRFHGTDAAAIEVHTPDHHEGRGWWKVDQINLGMPYKWGGFDTPESFLTGLREGKFAGDVSTPYKRRHLEAAVSNETVGIDCSGLISRAWRLSRSHSTRELPAICEELASWEELQAGDVLNCVNRHVLMFAAWKDPGVTFYAYEAGPYSGWRVTHNVVRAGYLRAHGFVPLRYKNITPSKPGPSAGVREPAPASSDLASTADDRAGLKRTKDPTWTPQHRIRR